MTGNTDGAAGDAGQGRAGRLAGGLVVLVVAVVYAGGVLGASPGRQPGIDSHYHFAMARAIAGGEIAPDMAADLPLTVYRDMSVDHYWGFHVLLTPFTAAADPELGMKAATVTLFATVLLALFAFLQGLGLRWAWAWALVPLALATLDWRYLMLRGGQLMVPITLGFAWLALRARRPGARRLGLLVGAYLAMLSYQAAVVLPAVHLAGLIALRVGRRDDEDAPPPLWEVGLTLLGLAAGLTLNPYMTADAATWRFAAYHLTTMGRDSLNLYPRVAEFHGFPPAMLVAHPAWGLLLAAALAAIARPLWGWWRRGRRPDATTRILGALALLGLLLGALALRATEYAVPLVLPLVAQQAGEVLPRARALWVRGAAVAAVGAALAWALWAQGGATTRALASVKTLPTHQYRGARPVLERFAGQPVLNLAEADYTLLLWEYPDVACVQGLSRYFLHPDRAAWEDLQALKRADADRRPESWAALARFYERGVRLVAAHWPTPLTRLADAHPEALEILFRSDASNASIYRLVPEALARRTPWKQHSGPSSTSPSEPPPPPR